MGADQGNEVEIAKPGRWTVGRVMVAVPVVLLSLVVAGFVGGVVGAIVGGVLGGCDLNFAGSQRVGCGTGMFLGLLVGLVPGAILGAKLIRSVRKMSEKVALVLGTLFVVGAVGAGWGFALDRKGPGFTQLQAQVPAGLGLDCNRGTSNYEAAIGQPIGQLTCWGNGEPVSWVELLLFEDSEAMDDFYGDELTGAIESGEFLMGLPLQSSYQADPNAGRKLFDPAEGMERDSTTASFFSDCQTYGAAEERYVSGDRSGRVLCMEYRWDGGSNATMVWTDERALVGFQVVGGPEGRARGGGKASGSGAEAT